MTRRVAAKVLVWSYFLLVVDQALVSLNIKFGIPVRPIGVDAVIACGLLAIGVSLRGEMRSLAKGWLFFLPFAVLIVMAGAMYHSQIDGPDFGALLLPPGDIPNNLSFVAWPTLNLLTCAGLFLLAEDDDMRGSIVMAALGALALQLVTMEADMWRAGIFGDMNGRAGGLAQNANIAARLVVFLAAITLSTRLAPYAITFAIVGIILAQSRSGAAMLVFAIALYAAARALMLSSRRMAGVNGRRVATFAGACIAILVATAYFSPVLNPSPETIATAAANHKSQPGQLPVATLDVPVPLEQRLASRSSVDGSFKLRVDALEFFWNAAKQNPLGYGTGFTSKFATGPHNTFLKLAVDNGIIAALVFLAVLIGSAALAIRTRSPRLVALSGIAALAAIMEHTVMIDTIVLPSIAIGMGAALSSSEHAASE